DLGELSRKESIGTGTAGTERAAAGQRTERAWCFKGRRFRLAWV
ncbi:hypothetical protein A2U01_0115332, partial [Trifolium medium]|nr:hypothetical protein [Trifolium medium]